MKLSITKSVTALAAAICLLAALTPAEAKIRCNGPYQIIQGNELATPYCEDNYLAKVARAAGIRVSNKAIRQNPHKKQEVCYFVGNDPRVSDICDQYLERGHNRK